MSKFFVWICSVLWVALHTYFIFMPLLFRGGQPFTSKIIWLLVFTTVLNMYTRRRTSSSVSLLLNAGLPILFAQVFLMLGNWISYVVAILLLSATVAYTYSYVNRPRRKVIRVVEENGEQLARCFCERKTILSYMTGLKPILAYLLVPISILCFLFPGRWTLNISEPIMFSYAATSNAQLPRFQKITESMWDDMSIERRKSVITEIERYDAHASGRASIPVIFAYMYPATLGSYGSNAIIINEYHMRESTAKEVIIALLHESRHAYQAFVVENSDLNNEYVQSSDYFAVVRSWIENKENYLRVGYQMVSYEDYLDQPIEVDARQYSEAYLYYYLEDG